MVKHTHGGPRGTAYIAVLGVSAVIAAMGVGAMMVVRVRGAADELTAQTIQARLNAEAGVDAVSNYIANNAGWRSRAPGVWFNNTSFGKGSFSVQVSDPADGDLSNRATDPILVRVTGMRGNATHIAEFQARPVGRAVSALSQALAANGCIQVMTGKALNVDGASISSCVSIRLDGDLYGSGQSLLNTGGGTATGGRTLLTLATLTSMPPSTVLTLYTGLATALPGGTKKLDKDLLAPGANTVGGGLNVDGVYVINASTDVTITSSRIYGTLIVNAPGQTVTIGNGVFMQPARADYPALIVNGALIITTDRTQTLDENTISRNLNPPGAPYQGVTNGNQNDSYPCEIRGLVHVKEKLALKDGCLIRGGVICESGDLTQAVQANSAEIAWDPSLYNSPPVGYTGAAQLMIVPGSWRQVVLP